MGCDNRRVRWNPIALCKYDQIARTTSSLEYASRRHRRITKARGLVRSRKLSAPAVLGFLCDRRDRSRHKQEQDECFQEIAEDQVDETRAEEQRNIGSRRSR
jgi:hypothetical protein